MQLIIKDLNRFQITVAANCYRYNYGLQLQSYRLQITRAFFCKEIGAGTHDLKL